ncbi:TPA: hypothetical protein I8190_000337 [Citrobacter freundii]|nr:hypothetical protein [Citrobacter freundii]HAT2347650.1 hypothetical protein [Citrobacter freundii]HAT2429240.1 hypothetical protein [Citrobacter freundii]HAT2498341.1 hypothetical protein [Citrobacter freundii]
MINIPDDYFLDADDELVDFLEKQGEDCIREIYQSNSVNKENGYKLLSILIVGIGSSFLLLTQKTPIDFLSAGIAAFTVYWSICAIYLVINVLTVHTYGLISTSPAALYTKGYKEISEADFKSFRERGFTGKNDRLSVMRRYRLKALCVTADELLRVNETIRTRLKKARMATILAPLYAIIVSAITYPFF